MTINNEDDQLFDERLEEAIKTYQHNYGLNVTGHLDATTVQQMMKPRCGVPDFIEGKNTMRKKDKTSLYTNQGVAWPSSEYKLTFQIQSGTLVPGAENMRSIVVDQLSKWEQYSPFTFEEVGEGNQSDLVFGFAVGDHGDRYPFDGPGGVVGHSFYPTGGVSHYDATEDWSDDPGINQVDLNTVVLHEIGHLLGLSHTQDQSAVMFAIVDRGVKKRELQQDDVLGIQAIYGKA
ncbi:hypothetical protein SOVF_131050 [Spinacia oleracea]|nr:hypothetical protein SOVF_131050 [Spinacia oleracea]